MSPAGLQLLEEELGMEVQDVLQVPKHHAALASELLGQVWPLHLREVLLCHVAQGPHILPLRGNHLLHDVLLLASIALA